MYVLVNAALVVWWARERAEGRVHSPLACVAVPLAGIVVLAAPYYYTLKPGQPSPLDLVPWVTGGIALLAIAFVAWVKTSRPEQLASAGRILAGEAEAEGRAATQPPAGNAVSV
jgi:amino acid transporter